MFERLSDGFTQVFRKLSGKAEISESNAREAMADVRTALLDADVNLAVVDKFCADVMADAVGTEVTKSLKPGEEMIGIVYHRLVELLGGKPGDLGPMPGEGDGSIPRVSPGPTIIMMAGLQGSGKTTTCGKLAMWLKSKGKNPLLVAADLQRPAAIDQLSTLAQQVGVPVYAERENKNPVQVCRAAVDFAKK